MNNGEVNNEVNQSNVGATTNGPQVISPNDVSNVVNNVQPAPQPVGVQTPEQTPAPDAGSTPVSEQPQEAAPGIVIAPPQEGPVDASAELKAKKEEAEKKAAEAPVEEVAPPVEEAPPVKVKPKKSALAPFLFLAVLIMGGYIYYAQTTHASVVNSLRGSCAIPNSPSGEVKLDVNSTLVQSLYHKVATNIREDLAEPNFNNSMKLYLAYRLISDSDKNDTNNCNFFDTQKMEPYTCEVSTKFVPKTIQVELMQLKIKELFGEQNNVELGNIQLGNSCIVGYEYIPDRGQFVQGYCDRDNAVFFTVDKTVTEAVRNHNKIVITEEVKYHEGEKLSVPEYLKSGLYYYTFQLDSNNNYIFVSKTYSSKY